MPIRWGWDQGRVAYMEFRVIQATASVLARFDGYPLDQPQDALRDALAGASGLSFASGPNEVWRNYRGVFGRTLLAARLDERLVSTDVCKKLAGADGEPFTSDDYFAFLIPRFYIPSPTSTAYDPDGPRCYPFCALIRYLLAQTIVGGGAFITVEDMLTKLVANDCVGNESLDYYRELSATAYRPVADEERQVRELARFLGQFTPLKWINPALFLDVGSAAEARRELLDVATPVESPREGEAWKEILALGSMDGWEAAPLTAASADGSDDEEIVIEGTRRSVIHRRVERSARIRRLYFETVSPPYYCDMCGANLAVRYPWTENILQVHHVLPLSSTLYAEERRTLIRDVVGVCPNCHTATHNFYGVWLRERSQNDFGSKDEARDVYQEAKGRLDLAS